MPKRAQTAYFLWLNEHREQIKEENPGISIIDLSKKAGELWRELTSSDKVVNISPFTIFIMNYQFWLQLIQVFRAVAQAENSSSGQRLVYPGF
jgi:structure-specific recognition protein 1